MTQREFFQAVVSADVAQELKDYASAQVQALDNKNSARNVKARAKKADENKPLVAQIKTILADGKTHTCAELSATTGANIPKVSSLIGTYFKDTVVKETIKVDKKKAVAYRLAQ